jgi:hypothetical protein
MDWEVWTMPEISSLPTRLLTRYVIYSRKAYKSYMYTIIL